MHTSSSMKNTNDKIKFHAVDILEKLPEEQMLRSYNEEFYTTLNKERDLTAPMGDNKLFYHFEQNMNASVSSTTGQLIVNLFIY